MTGFVDPAFKLVKSTVPGFHIWRIENFEVKAVTKDHHGSFFEGDSYIVFSAQPAGRYAASQSKNFDSNAKLEIHIHFWLGKETSTDESTTAAIKSVELDDFLGGAPIQHREVQGHETDRFKSYFKNGIRILKGGVATGFRHVTDDFNARLFQIKGRRSPLLTEQPSIAWEHFNSGDSFILETKSRVFVWVGKESNKMEKLQAAKVATQFRDERPDRSIVFIEEDEEEHLTGEDRKLFEEHLTISGREVKPAESDPQDAASEAQVRGPLRLYECSDEDGTCKIVLVKEGLIEQALLDSKDSFIIDNGPRGIWVWIGKRASAEERKQGMINAQGFISKKNYPQSTSVTRVIDGAEPTEFKMLFVQWKDPNAIVGLGRQQSMSSIAKTVHTKFDATTLHDTPSLAADTQLVDDGTGQTTIWRLHGKELEDVPKDMHGVFFSGDCYIVHYVYKVFGRENHILYFWLGAHSSQDERGTIAWHTVKKDDELHGAAVQVRVVQMKEPPHFLTIFKGKMTVFNGGYASSFDGSAGKDEGIPTTFLIHVRGEEEMNTRAVQVELRGSSLNSNDVFVLCSPEQSYVWCGKGSTGDERERAKAVAEQWCPNKNYDVVFESQEKQDFWSALGGREQYANDERLTNPDLNVPARLFHCSNATGNIKVEEIINFVQNDLVPDDVMILDTGRVVFIWIGKGANKEERLEATRVVHDYLSTDPRGRDIDTPIMQVQQGYEPPNFTGFFGVWDSRLWEESSYEHLKSKLQPAGVTEVVNVPTVNGHKHDEEVVRYSLDQLVGLAPEELPDDVDVRHKENHLTEDDFRKTFSMDREDFDNLPAWKQQNLKRQSGLF